MKVKANEGFLTAPAGGTAAECPPYTDEPDYRYYDRQVRAALARVTGGISLISLGLAGVDWGLQTALAPGKLAHAAVDWARGWLDDTVRWLPLSDAPPAIPSTESRFADEGWQAWPYRCWRDAFLRNEAFWQSLTGDVDGLSRHHQRVAAFCMRQWTDMCSPGNVWWMNPAVVRETQRTCGTNFVQGTRHWAEDFADMAANLPGADPRPRQLAYMPGKDVAITPGKVVFRNALLELIQYTPSTEAVWKEPVLIVPSWIMKYYILDLQPHDSLVRYLVEQGHTVFMISWKNPGDEARDRGLHDYLHDGILAALYAAQARCEGACVHVAGYCLGGTLLAICAAKLARDTDGDPLASVTFFATETDFTEPGELGLFIDKSAVATLDALMWSQGYLDGPQMTSAFQMLNARDLIWSRMMSEYLLGQRLRANDLISWNRDITRLPYRLHSECLHKLFLANELAEGKLCVGGRPVALSDLNRPIFMVGTEHDHVSPWRSVYKLHLLTRTALTFLLTSGGHNAGIVSEPDHPRRRYRFTTRKPGDPYLSPERFLTHAEYHEGSWWPAWSHWLADRSSAKCQPRDPAPGAVCDAPGRYVMEP